MKFVYFFLFLWVIFALLDPDPDPATQIYADPCGSGSATLPSPSIPSPQLLAKHSMSVLAKGLVGRLTKSRRNILYRKYEHISVFCVSIPVGIRHVLDRIEYLFPFFM
jgi:hypothetical protein